MKENRQRNSCSMMDEVQAEYHIDQGRPNAAGQYAGLSALPQPLYSISDASLKVGVGH
jgi:hypothetical protein